MATFVKYDTFVAALANKQHDLSGTAGSGADTCNVSLSNTAPTVATDAVLADTTDLSTANGYTAGGASATNVGSASGGTFTLTGTDIVFTASGGTVGPFRYAILRNATANLLIAYWDYGSSVTLADGETFTVDFGASILTLA